MADVATPDHGDYGKRPAKMKQFGKRPARPDFTERDDKLARLQAKVPLRGPGLYPHLLCLYYNMTLWCILCCRRARELHHCRCR